MRSAENRWTTGQGHVDGVRGETLLEIFGHERGVPGTPGCRELGLECVATPTGDRSLISREGSQTAQNECQLPLGTEKSPLPGNYLVERRRRLEFNHRPRADVVDRLLRCHATTCPTLPVSGHEKTPRQGRGVSTRYHPASPACRRARICPLTLSLGTTTRRASRVHRPAREGTSPPRHPAVFSHDRRPCQARRRVLVSVSAISFDVVRQYTKGCCVTSNSRSLVALYSHPGLKPQERANDATP